MARKRYLKTKMSSTGIQRLERNNPFTPETSSFADLITDASLDEGMVHYCNEKKARVKPKPKSIKGYPPVQATLDLHGEIAVVAERKTVRFINMSKLEGLKTVRIVTGKGLHSPGGKAILPDVVEAQLILLKYEKSIFDYGWDKKLKLKSGAVVVYL